MKISELREKAKPLGIKAGPMKKADLIREIQIKEGNFPCFGTAIDYCDQAACCSWKIVSERTINASTNFSVRSF